VVVRQRFLHRPARPAWRISLVHLALATSHMTVQEFLVDPRGAIGALGFRVDGLDLCSSNSASVTARAEGTPLRRW